MESTHEEQVWKSHLNYFDEVKPTDIDRELLLTIVNGGNMEINPKNKRPYNYYVNTNNIFTSNDQINLMQRRVSIIKFGNRLNGRPFGEGTLKEIITNIMNSLPNFNQYFALYNKVSVYNENKLNPLAIESILTFFNTKLNFVTENNTSTLYQHVIFTAHDIYNCIKGSYNKQIIPSERKEAIKNALEYFEKKKLIQLVVYKTSTTKNYKITGENYLKIMEEYSKLNTKNEKNDKISHSDLKKALMPYFSTLDTAPKFQDDENTKSSDSSDISDTQTAVNQTVGIAEENIPVKDFYNPYEVNNHTKIIAKRLYNELMENIAKVINELPQENLFMPVEDIMKNVVDKIITQNMCQTISLDLLSRTLKCCLPDFNENHHKLLEEKYRRECCFWENGTVDYGEDRKVKNLNGLELAYKPAPATCTSQEDGSLLTEEVPYEYSKKTINDEEEWQYYQMLYNVNMEKRQNILSQLFRENQHFLSINSQKTADTNEEKMSPIVS